jgi:chromosome segregation ATPase
MSFLDRFKRKGLDSPEPEARPDLPANKPSAASQAGAPQKPAPAKPAAPPSATAPTRPEAANEPSPAAAPAVHTPELKLSDKKANPIPPTQEPPRPEGPEGELILELGDFLHRIPQQMLQPGPHDVHTELRFGVSDLADRIARGQTTLPLSELQKRVPAIFRDDAPTPDADEIRFPWQKVMKLLTDAGSPTPGLGLNSAAAESLAEKLKSRRAVRNIIPGQAAGEKKSPPASPPAPAPASRPPRTAATRPAPAPAPIPDPAPVPAATELELPFAPNPEDDEKLTRQELIRSRDAAKLQAARVKGEYERQLTTLAQERKALAEERDKATAELARASQELHDKLEQIAFEKTVAAKTSETSAKLQQECDTLQRELNDRKREVEALKSAAGKAQAPGDDTKFKALLAERDALAQQLAAAARNAAKKPEPGPAIGGQSQRQIDEFQRRIVALEHGQRDTALELQREREAKIKLERQLANADRLQKETAVHVESSQATLRREFEAAARKRDAETARALKEAQEQIESANAAKNRLAAELEEARARTADQKQAPAALPAIDTGFEARVVAQFEADIESYRERIKALLQERNALASEKEKLHAEFESLAKESKAPPAAETEALQAELKKVAAERDELAGKLKQADEKGAAAETAPSAEALAKVHEEFQGQLAALREQLAAITRERDDAHTSAATAIAELRAQNDELTAALNAAPAAGDDADLAAETARLTRELDSARASSNTTITNLRAETRKLSLEREVALKEGEKLLAEIDEIKAQTKPLIEQFERDRAALRKEREDQAAAFRGQIEAHLAERDDFATKARTLSEELAKTRAEQEEQASKSREAAAEAEGKLKQIEQERAALGNQLAALTDELTGARQQHDSASAAFNAEREKLAEELAKARAEQENFAQQLATEKTDLEKDLAAARDESISLHEKITALAGDLASTRKERDTALAEAQATRDKLSSDATSLSEELAKTQREHGKLAAEKADLEKNLAAARKGAASLQETIIGLTSDLQAAQTQRDAALAEVQSTREKLSVEAKTLAEQLTSTRADRGHLTAQLQTAKLDLDNAVAAADRERTALEMKVAGLTRDLESALAQHQSAHAEQQKLASEREHLQTQITELTRNLEIATHEHGAAFRELETEHQALRSLRDALDAELAAAKSAHEQTSSDLQRALDEMASARAAAEQRLAEVERTASERLGKIEDLEGSLNEARAAAEHHEAAAREHQQTLETLTSKRDRTLDEKDAALTALAAEKAALLLSTGDQITELAAKHDAALAEMEAGKAREIDALTQRLNDEIAAAKSERERMNAALDDAQEKITSLIAALEKSERESAAVAQQLATNGVETDKQIATLTSEIDRLRSQHEALATEFDEARESHKAQSGVFAREFKAVVRQRDDALARIEAEHRSYEDKAAELARQTAELARREEEIGTRFERDLARARRERDSVVQQRDSLRDRIEQLIEEQRKMLEDVAQQASRSTSRRGEGLSITPPPAKPARGSKARREKETNVIDITTAEIVPAESEPEHRLNIQRIRPVAIPPPQVRIL